MSLFASKPLENLERILERIGDVVLVIDCNGKIHYSNPVFHSFLCQEEHCQLANSLMDLLYQPYEKMKSFFSCHEGGRPIVLDLQFRLPGGELRTLETRIEPWKSSELERGLLLIGRDVSEERKTRVELELYKARIDGELKVAEVVQRSLLPEPQETEKFKLDFFYRPLLGIGGDYACVESFGSQGIFLTVCDVSGHGIGPSILSNRINGEVRHLLKKRYPPEAVVRVLNDFVLKYFSRTKLLITFFCMKIDFTDMSMEWSGAAHPPPMHFMPEADGKVHFRRSQRTLLGLKPFENVPDSQGRCEIHSGDKILLYTDAFLEADRACTTCFRLPELGALFQKTVHDAEGKTFFPVLLDNFEKQNLDPNQDDMTGIYLEIK